jgi:catechol 2,3-dioxygenase-like lactoylglutathione lyase family enzyme
MAQERPVVNQLNLVARDMEATLTFYRRLGLDIPDAAVWQTASGVHHVEATMPNGFTIEFDSAAMAAHYNAGWRPPTGEGTRAVIGLPLPSRDAVDERYGTRGGAGRQPPYDTPGARYVIVEDPDGPRRSHEPARSGPPQPPGALRRDARGATTDEHPWAMPAARRSKFLPTREDAHGRTLSRCGNFAEPCSSVFICGFFFV